MSACTWCGYGPSDGRGGHSLTCPAQIVEVHARATGIDTAEFRRCLTYCSGSTHVTNCPNYEPEETMPDHQHGNPITPSIQIRELEALVRKDYAWIGEDAVRQVAMNLRDDGVIAPYLANQARAQRDGTLAPAVLAVLKRRAELTAPAITVALAGAESLRARLVDEHDPDRPTVVEFTLRRPAEDIEMQFETDLIDLTDFAAWLTHAVTERNQKG